jgi:hypothetical protein
MRHLGSKCHINDYVTPRYYDIFLVSQRCHIKEVRLYTKHTHGIQSQSVSPENKESYFHFVFPFRVPSSHVPI